MAARDDRGPCSRRFFREATRVEQGPSDVLRNSPPERTTLGKVIGGIPGIGSCAAAVIRASSLAMPALVQLMEKAGSTGNLRSAAGETSAWVLREGKSKMTDHPEVTLSLEASGSVKGWLSSSTPRLVLSCEERKLKIYVDVGTTVQSGGSIWTLDRPTVGLRFDQGEPTTERWQKSTDDQGLSAPDSNALLNRLSRANTFLFEFTPFQAASATAEFNLVGLESGLPKLLAACPKAATRQSK